MLIQSYVVEKIAGKVEAIPAAVEFPLADRRTDIDIVVNAPQKRATYIPNEIEFFPLGASTCPLKQTKYTPIIICANMFIMQKATLKLE
jgi:hypothetical protein